jgi:hypothetical protein
LQTSLSLGSPQPGWRTFTFAFSSMSMGKSPPPRERLASELGEVNAEIAIEGFRALLRRDDFPRLDAQIDLRA